MLVVRLGMGEVGNVRFPSMTSKCKFCQKIIFFKILCLFHQKAIKCHPKKIFRIFLSRIWRKKIDFSFGKKLKKKYLLNFLLWKPYGSF